MKRRSFIGQAVAGGAASWHTAGRPAAGAEGAALAGRAAASIDWPDLPLVDGSQLAASAWHDTAAVLVFWSTDCPYCKRHNVHLERLHRASRHLPLRVLGVALDSDVQAVRRVAGERGYSFSIAANGQWLRPRFTPRRVIPMTCVVDRRGLLRLSIAGEMSEADVMALAPLALGN